MTRRLTKTERITRERLLYHLWVSQTDLDIDESLLREEVPDAWHTIVEDVDCYEPKQKVSLYLDKSVARVFQAMGNGYQARINRILGTWVQLRAAGLLERERMIEKRWREDFGRSEMASDDD